MLHLCKTCRKGVSVISSSNTQEQLQENPPVLEDTAVKVVNVSILLPRVVGYFSGPESSIQDVKQEAQWTLHSLVSSENNTWPSGCTFLGLP